MTNALIIGNWKMNTSLEGAIALARATADAVQKVGGGVDVGICPPYLWIVPVRDAVGETALRIGAQDCAATDDGAYTGDVSATMLSTCCSFTLVGHSERRSNHHETDEIVRQKLHQAFNAGLHVILCVGESEAERQAGRAEQVVQRQLDSALDGLGYTRLPQLSIAYEPVWAIGTGVAATENDAADMATVIRNDLVSRFGSAGDQVRILYGGSANDRNASSFLAANNVDGLLVGSASLSPEAFGRMIASAVQRG